MSNQDNHLSHIDDQGKASMVDVSAKPPTARRAVAEATVRVNETLAQAIQANALKKGDLIGTARLAGIQAAKQTAALIPLCHPLPIDAVTVDITQDGCVLTVLSSVTTTWKTGVEMEALTAATAAALTMIDMGKAVDKGIVIERVRLLEKTGGRSGTYRAPEQNADG